MVWGRKKGEVRHRKEKRDEKLCRTALVFLGGSEIRWRDPAGGRCWDGSSPDSASEFKRGLELDKDGHLSLQGQ